MGNQLTRNIFVFAIVVVIAFLAYAFLTMPDRRNTAERVGDAVHELPQGLDRATRQLEDRTPGQKLGDKIKDNTEEH